ncbi:MAG: chaperone NapD [bacterium]|nr:chaperone NapD [bacterium]
MNISSVVIKTLPEHLESVKKSLEDSGLCEVHFSDDQGRIVAVIEGDDDADESEKLKKIADLPHIASADFSTTYIDPDVTDG